MFKSPLDFSFILIFCLHCFLLSWWVALRCRPSPIHSHRLSNTQSHTETQTHTHLLITPSVMAVCWFEMSFFSIAEIDSLNIYFNTHSFIGKIILKSLVSIIYGAILCVKCYLISTCKDTSILSSTIILSSQRKTGFQTCSLISRFSHMRKYT